MRMSRKEVTDEHKQREGDPRIRQKIRELQREMLKRASGLGKIRDADVLITNPRRLAIALQYKRGEMAAPKIVAKGAGELADHIRSMARRHRIPIVENRKLARALFRDSGIEQPLKEKYFPEVARILVWADALRKQRHLAALGGAA
jgi:flagellar biosynthesis protein FlhB